MATSANIWMYIASSASITLLAVSGCLLHRSRYQTSVVDYLAGAATWSVSVAVKIGLAAISLAGLGRIYGSVLPLSMTIPLNGLLTGITECGGTALVARTKRWQTASWHAAVGFGLGFGCFEAVALAVPLLASGLTALAPETVRPEDAKMILASLSDPHRPFTFFWERAIAVPVHLLSSVLVIMAVQRSQVSLFCWGFALKSLIDAVPTEAQIPELLLQIIYGAFGAGSIIAFHRFAQTIQNNDGRQSNT